MNRLFLLVTIAGLLLAPVRPAISGDRGIASFYGDEELIPLHEQYSRGVANGFKNVILPLLLPDQKNKLKDVRLEFPLRAEKFEPDAFLAHDRTIVFSVASMKFWNDILTAAEWLTANDFSLETVADYALMMKYRGLNKHLPPPLKALCIPADALEDENVKNHVNISFSTTMTFILLHELGHVYFDHPGYGGKDFEQVRNHESEADNFAIEAMARIGDPPDIVTFMMMKSAMSFVPSDFPNEGDYKRYMRSQTHPLFSARLRSIAESFVRDANAFAAVQGDRGAKRKFEQIGAMIAELSSGLEDPGMQDIMATRANILTEDSFGPRRKGESLPKPCKTSSIAADVDFSGAFKGTWTYLNSDYKLDITFNFVRNGDSVTGSFLWGKVPGRIDGSVEGRNLYFKFQVPIGNGSGVLRQAQKGQLTGTWGDKDSPDDGGGIVVKR
jgi:hypothetical protein